MRFRHYIDELADVNKIVVDGNACGSGLQLSHWPGNTTPEAFKADLSIEIVLRFLAFPQRELYTEGIELVSNDHFDTDGLLSIWALLNPSEAPRHVRALKDAAEAGDFYHFTSPAAVQFDFIVKGFEDPEQSPLGSSITTLSYADRSQAATEVMLAQLPDLLYETDRYREMWGQPYEDLMERIRVLNRTATVREWPGERLSVIISPSALDHYTRNIFAAGHRILEVNPTGCGTQYRLFYREYLWYDIVSRAVSPRYILTGCAEKLNALEGNRSGGAWGVTEWSPALLFVAREPSCDSHVGRRDPLGQSRLAPETVERVLREELYRLDRDALTRPRETDVLTNDATHYT